MKIRRSFIYKLWTRFLTKFGDLMIATEPPKVKAAHIRELLKLAKPGDVMCRKYTYYFDSYFIKGKYTHSGVIIDSENMIHAIAEGVGKIDIIDFMKDADGFILLRPVLTNFSGMKSFLESKIGVPYDFIFKKDRDAFYCHELTWNALQEGGVQLAPKDDIIYAEDIIKICSIIYEPEIK